mmetsp:Transcript_27375/g.45764  ORF Transcript_27375/g.45764 Transcript_27375/m.45764 type:complete len:298 (+) Transcript_27375:128-1021(+)|eukprot:CAMPEP_0198203410 /NCGR_PEP_ID=MMETSP1445-20131203/6703_1 /TAXON_ID=36898 /ORGANISM="Pyramimonas sp., Strain CCMP2087" /LENGTH=297 /DNA_ID=CAMNT_0043874799 /DNA_START=128 /DNA_END=1021 /DNA_ORIENTATION=-
MEFATLSQSTCCVQVPRHFTCNGRSTTGAYASKMCQSKGVEPQFKLRNVYPRGLSVTFQRKIGVQRVTASVQPSTGDVTQAEATILKTLSGMSSRGQSGSDAQKAAVAQALDVLERSGGISDPALSPLVEGKWQLLYTSKSSFDIKNPLGKRVDGTKPGLEGVISNLFGETVAKGLEASSSPIQRTVTSLDAFEVSQDITFEPSDPRVDQIVRFGDAGRLRLSAAASRSPDNMRRIDFAFDLAYFEFKILPFRIPYPVPFKLLGNEAKGWLDTIYLSETLRISRGNKGTTFVLKRLQ